MKKNTDELQKELTSAPDLSRFLSENAENFIDEPFCELLKALFEKSGLSKSALARRAGTSDVYLYQIFSGGRVPSRDRTLCLCFGLSATLEETQELLKHSGFAQLYAKNRRDAIIMYGLSGHPIRSDQRPAVCGKRGDPLPKSALERDRPLRRLLARIYPSRHTNSS